MSHETVIASTELNKKKKDGARTKKDERGEEEKKKEDNRKKPSRPSCESDLAEFPPGLSHPPTTKKGSCSRRTTRRLTRAAYHYPFAPRATHRLSRPPFPLPVSSSSSFSSSSIPRLFTLPSSPVATLRASIRAGQQSLRHPRRGSSRGGGNMAALARWIHYGRVA